MFLFIFISLFKPFSVHIRFILTLIRKIYFIAFLSAKLRKMFKDGFEFFKGVEGEQFGSKLKRKIFIF
jgi:hypothetical protein